MSVQRTRLSRNGRAAAPRAAFYDLDGTLAGLSLVHAALYMLSNLGEWSGRLAYLAAFVARAPRLYRAEQEDRRLLNIALFESLKGVSRDRLFSLGDEYCERVLLGRLYPQALELIEANREAGLLPVLVTGSPDFIAEPLARRLRISEVAANRLVMSRGRATGRLRAPVFAGSEKAAWCIEWAKSHSIALGECWGYADSFYDLPFLAVMGHPVAVNPDRRLYSTAVSRHWPVIRFAKERHVEPRWLPAELFGRIFGGGASDGAA